jgi:hypothetical protein
MPKIQLLRRDSTVIELDAENISFAITRGVQSFPLPFIATRYAIDLNQTDIGISINGILTDDEGEALGTGSAFTIDLSQSSGQIPSSTWYGQYSTSAGAWNTVKADLDGVDISFKSIGQKTAGLGETTSIRLANGTTTSSVADSIIGINISSTTNTQTLSSTITTALASANITVNGATTAFSTAFSVTTSLGQQKNNSYYHQTGDVNATYTGERIQIKNQTIGKSGNLSVTVTKGVNAGSNTFALVEGSQGRWDNQFLVTNLTGGLDSTKMTMGDKVQQILNLANASAGGALISPNVMTGELLDLPSSVASFDASRFLNIEDAATVKKYIVGVRIPYDSIASSALGQRVLRQYIVPAGPGTDYAPEKNTQSYDPTVSVNNQIIRPNPYLEQGVAIPCVVNTWNPSYNAGDGYWSYDLTLSVVEQLVGI